MLCVLTVFGAAIGSLTGESARPKSNHRAADAGSPGLTSRQRGDAFGIDRGRPRAIFMILQPRLGLHRPGESPLSDSAA